MKLCSIFPHLFQSHYSSLHVMTEYSTISIPKELKAQIEELIAPTGFQNVSEFTKHVLRDIAAQGAFEGPEEYRESMGKVRERLENLGYLPDGDMPSEQHRDR